MTNNFILKVSSLAASTQPACIVLNHNNRGLQSIVTQVKKGVLLSFLIRHVNEIRHICSVESFISLSESLIEVQFYLPDSKLLTKSSFKISCRNSFLKYLYSIECLQPK